MPDVVLEPLSPETARAAAAKVATCGDVLNAYRFAHAKEMSREQYYALEGYALHLYQLAATLYTRATMLTVEHAEAATRAIQDATDRLTDVSEQIANVRQAVAIAASVVGLASAIAVGNFAEIVKAASGVQSAMKG